MTSLTLQQPQQQVHDHHHLKKPGTDPVEVTSSSTVMMEAKSPTKSTQSPKLQRGVVGGLMKPLVVKMPSLRNVRSVGNLDIIASTLSGGSGSGSGSSGGSSGRSGGLSKPILRKHKSVTVLPSASSKSGNQNFDWNGAAASAVDLRLLAKPTLRGCLSSGSNHSSNSIGSAEKMKRAVSFSKIEVREYERTIGDNVVSSGVPVSLGWNSTKLGDMDIDTYEQHKQPRTREEMLLPSHVRMEMTKHAGFSLKERMEAAKASNIERNRRHRSKAKTIEMDKMDYALEKASRSLTKLRRKISPMHVVSSKKRSSGGGGESGGDADIEIEDLIRMDRLRTKQMQQFRRTQSDPTLDLEIDSDSDDDGNDNNNKSERPSMEFRSANSEPNLSCTCDGDPFLTKEEGNESSSSIFGKAPVKRRSLLEDDSDEGRHRNHFDNLNLSDSDNDDDEGEEEEKVETTKDAHCELHQQQQGQVAC